jgi:hypothetical protein
MATEGRQSQRFASQPGSDYAAKEGPMKPKRIDFAAMTPDAIRDHVTARLSRGGGGHSLSCLSRPSAAGQVSHTCSSGPESFCPHPALAAVVRALAETGQVDRVGAFLWLGSRPAAAVATPLRIMASTRESA